MSRFQQAKPLYRRILRLHRDPEKLDPYMRALGDVYVKKEFRHIALPSMSTNPAML